MSVYVDDYMASYRGMKMSHLMADTVDELHAFAARLGLRREWFQDKSAPHYDVCKQKRWEAIQRFGAIPLKCGTQEWREVYRSIRKRKELQT